MPDSPFEDPPDPSLPPRHLAPIERSEYRRERALAAAMVEKQQAGFMVVFFGAMATIGTAVLSFTLWVLLPAIVIILIARWFLRFQSKSAKAGREVSGVIIRDERRHDRSTLASRMEQLSASGFDGYAITLGKFLQHKHKIDAEIAAGSKDSPQAEQVSKLVDSICFGVAEQFERVSALEKRLAALSDSPDSDGYQSLAKDRTELLTQVIDAYKTLKKTRHELPLILDPSATATAKHPGVDLGELVDQLRHEEEIARKTRERMQRDAIDLI